MTHYEERLEKDLAVVREKFAALAESVEQALTESVQALFESNDELAYSVILGDLPINRASRELDRICHKFFAVHLPGAGHLREVSAVIRANLEIERVGDYATTICREAVQIGHPPEGIAATRIRQMSEDAQGIFGRAVQSFKARDTEGARADIALASRVARGFSANFQEFVEEDTLRTAERLYSLVIFNSLARVVDQSKNICEETVFAVTGQGKTPKSYRILFLDEDNSTLGPMAQVIARKQCPQGGEYFTASRAPADAYGEGLEAFLDGRGMGLGPSFPKGLFPDDELSSYHVIVSLQGPVKSYIEAVPFHTVALEWEIDSGTGASDTPDFESLYRQLALRVQDLMTTMHGDEV